MTILNYILRNHFVGVLKTSTNNLYPSTNPFGGRASLACAYANVLPQRDFAHEENNILSICADKLHRSELTSQSLSN